MKIDLFIFILIVLLVLGLVTEISTPSGTITGFTRDSGGIAFPNVNIIIDGPGVSRTAVSAGDGSFSFIALPPGTYQITAYLAGGLYYQGQATVSLGVGETKTLDVVLEKPI